MQNKKGDVEKKKVENEEKRKQGGWRTNEVGREKIFVKELSLYIISLTWSGSTNAFFKEKEGPQLLQYLVLKRKKVHSYCNIW